MKVLRVYCWSCRNVSHVTGVGFYLLCSHISRPCPRPADWQTQEVTSTNQLINTDPTKLLCVCLFLFYWHCGSYICVHSASGHKKLWLVMIVIHGVSWHTRRFGAFSVHPRKEKHTFEFLHLILTNKHEKRGNFCILWGRRDCELAPAYRDAQVKTRNLDKSRSDLCRQIKGSETHWKM